MRGHDIGRQHPNSKESIQEGMAGSRERRKLRSLGSDEESNATREGEEERKSDPRVGTAMRLVAGRGSRRRRSRRTRRESRVLDYVGGIPWSARSKAAPGRKKKRERRRIRNREHAVGDPKGCSAAEHSMAGGSLADERKGRGAAAACGIERHPKRSIGAERSGRRRESRFRESRREQWERKKRKGVECLALGVESNWGEDGNPAQAEESVHGGGHDLSSVENSEFVRKRDGGGR